MCPIGTHGFPLWHKSLSSVTADIPRTRATLYNFIMPKETLQVETRPGKAPDTRVLRLAGSLTLSSCFDLQDRLRADTSTSCLIVDMTDVPYVDSSGIGCLVNGYIAQHMAGGRMVLVGVNKRVLETLHETRVQQFFSIFPTVEEAEREVMAGKK